MPQFDKLIFLMENIGFVMSFFFMVFYNQYLFFPNLLKNIFVRKLYLINLNQTTKVFSNLLILYSMRFHFNLLTFNDLFLLFEQFFNNCIKKINFFISFKIRLIYHYLCLIKKKFQFLFSLFLPVYRQYTVELKKKIIN